MRGYWGLVAFSLLGSLFSRLAHLDPGPIAPVAAFLTLLVGTIAAFRPFVLNERRRAYAALAGVLILGTGVELCGVTTGLPFGRYAYTDRWWPTAPLPGGGRFPIQVPIAWLLMVGASTLALPPRWGGDAGPAGSVAVRAVAAGALASSLDLLMEPVMAGPLGYWRWIEEGPLPGHAPVLNALGWFVTAAAGAAILLTFGANRTDSKDPRWVLAGHLVLTLGIGAILTLA